MTEIQFTERTATIFKRTIECHLEDWEKQRKRIQEEEDTDEINVAIVIASHECWDISMMVDVDDIDDDDDEFDWSHIRTLILIDRNKGCRTGIYGWKSIANYKSEDIDELVKSYRICLDCDEYCWKDSNFCKNCYPFIIEHTEDCCCCLDKSLGVWYKLPCGHILHQRCYNKIEKEHPIRCQRKCPLCRAICEHDSCVKL